MIFRAMLPGLGRLGSSSSVTACLVISSRQDSAGRTVVCLNPSISELGMARVDCPSAYVLMCRFSLLEHFAGYGLFKALAYLDIAGYQAEGIARKIAVVRQ